MKLSHCQTNSSIPYQSAPTFSTLSTTQSSDPICELASSTIRYGPTSTSEIGHDIANLKARRVILFVGLESYKTIMESIDQHCNPRKGGLKGGVYVDVYDEICVEPTNVSFQHAINYMTNKQNEEGAPYDAVIALGGGSTIDTAKAANLYSCYPPKDFYDYVNPPLGKGTPVPGPLIPFIAVPTTAGTGSETTVSS